MGMSYDLEAAIEAGSTWIRVGSDLFGKEMSYNFSACKFFFIGAGNMTEAMLKDT